MAAYDKPLNDLALFCDTMFPGQEETGNFVLLTGNQTISGIKTFNEPPVCSVTATTPTQLVNKSYVDNIATVLTNADYASVTFPVGTTLSLALAEPLLITAAGNWLVTGNYQLTSVLAASNIDNNGTSFLVWDYTTTHSAGSSQLHNTDNGSTVNTYRYTHTISKIINFAVGLTYPITLTAQVSVIDTTADLTGSGKISGIQIN